MALICAALELQEPRPQSGHEPAPALVQRLDVPDLRELAQRALDLKGLDLVGGSIGADVPLHSVPVPEAEGRFGQRRQIPHRIACLLRRRRKLGHEALRNLLEREIGRDLQTETPRAVEQRHQIDAMPSVLLRDSSKGMR